MRIAYLDCFSGISGDMFLGALVDAGVPAELLEKTVAVLDIGARLEISRVNRSGITATKVDVYAHGEKDLPREVYWEQQAQRSVAPPQLFQRLYDGVLLDVHKSLKVGTADKNPCDVTLADECHRMWSFAVAIQSALTSIDDNRCRGLAGNVRIHRYSSRTVAPS